MRLRIVLAAENEFTEAAERYDSESPGGGERLIAATEAVFSAVENHPERYPRYEASTLEQVYRRVRVGKSPYYIVYRIESDEIVIVAYAHASRAPGYWEGR